MHWDKLIVTGAFAILGVVAVIVIAVPCRYPDMNPALDWIYGELEIRWCR